MREIGVGKADDRVILLAHPCRAQADRLDRAVLVAKAAEVADPDRLVREQRQTPDDVLEPWPDGEGDGKSADAKAGDHGSERDTEETRGEKDQGDQGGEVAQPEEGADQLAVDAALLHPPGPR